MTPRLEEGEVDLALPVGDRGHEHLLPWVAPQRLGDGLGHLRDYKHGLALAERRHVGERVGRDVGAWQVLEEVPDGPDALVLLQERGGLGTRDLAMASKATHTQVHLSDTVIWLAAGPAYPISDRST